MYGGRTLVVILCMHRSGSSSTAYALQRLGMSLGPFDLLGPTEENKFGYFEAQPIINLDIELQRIAQGFIGDMPVTPEMVRDLCARHGKMSCSELALAPYLDRGRELIEALVASAPISGFKDPRLPLIWPFWQDVLAGFPGLRIVKLVVLRSPHEIAMSLFKRSRGQYGYRDILDVSAIHFQRMQAIVRECAAHSETVPVVRFDRSFEPDLRNAAAHIGLPWSEEVFQSTYDAASKHYAAANVVHPAQELFESLGGVRNDTTCDANLELMQAASEKREQLLRSEFANAHNVLGHLQRVLNIKDTELAERARHMEAAYQDHIGLLKMKEHYEAELKLIKSGKLWRFKEGFKSALRRIGVSTE